MAQVTITEYLAIDLDREMWLCRVCARDLIGARENYKRGCLVYERDPDEVYPPVLPAEEFHLGISDGYGIFVEFYCPGCGVMIENELLPEGHPVTQDFELDLDALKAKQQQEEAS